MQKKTNLGRSVQREQQRASSKRLSIVVRQESWKKLRRESTRLSLVKTGVAKKGMNTKQREVVGQTTRGKLRSTWELFLG